MGWRAKSVVALLCGGLAGGTTAAYQATRASVPTPPPPTTAPEPQPHDPPRVAASENRDQQISVGDDAPTHAPHTLPKRPRYRRTKAVRKLDWIAKKRLRAPGADIVNPCVENRDDGTCARTALGSVFAAFDKLVAGTAEDGDHVTVVTFGNSLIASDRVTDIVRKRLQSVFGDGGYGIVYVEPLHFFGRRAWTGKSSRGWYREYLTQHYGGRKKAKYPLGITGGHHVTYKKRASTTWRIGDAEEASILWLDHKKASPFALYVDGKHIETVKPQKDGSARITHVPGLKGKKKLKLKTKGPRVVIYGATLERPRAGVVWDTVGIVAASANTFLLVDEDVLQTQLQERAPKLLVHMLGGNEHRRIDRKVFTYAQVEKDFDTYLQRMKRVAPEADCLVVGPVDAVYPWRKKGREFKQRVWLTKVNEMQKVTAQQYGCAYLDLYAAMGGRGALKRMNKYGYLSNDRIHPKSKGLDVLGELFARALFDAYQNEGRILDTPTAQ